MSDTTPSTTGCTCPVAGWCERHQMQKHEIWWNDCRTREKWWRWYEAGNRHEPAASATQPREPEAPLEGVGDVLAAVFEKTGVAWLTERAAKLAGLSGCGCSERQAILNELLPFKPDGISNRMWSAVIRLAGKET